MRNSKNCIVCKVGIETANKKYPAMEMRDKQINGLCGIHYSNYRCATGQCGGGG